MLAVVLLMCMGAFAEETGEFVQGGSAVKLADEYFMRVDEGDTAALVRIDAEGAPHIAMRGDEIGDMVVSGDTLYFLMRAGDAWTLMGLNGGGVHTVYEFAPGDAASDIGVRDGMLFVLVNDKLSILYPAQGLCLPLAGAQMDEYIVYDDNAYYVSLENAATHRLADSEGNVAGYTAGSLCRVDLSTGKTNVLLTEGVDDLMYADGKLYFHNYLDRYLMGAGENMSVEGYLYSYDIASGDMKKLTGTYDWEYMLVSGDAWVLRQDGLIRLSDGEVMAMLPDSVQTGAAGDAVICFDVEEMTFTVVK